MSAVGVDAVQKKEYRNNTAGWIGVVTLDHNGAEQGVNIEPHGTIWLSDSEAILTARAPRQPKDNPFLERTYVMVDAQTGMRREVPMRPIALVSAEARDMYSSDRYVPGIVSDAEARALVERAARDGSDGPRTALTAAREAEVLGGPAMERSTEPAYQEHPTPPSTGAEPPSMAEPPAPRQPHVAVPPVGDQLHGSAGAAGSVPDVSSSWTDPPVAPGRVLRGSLNGDDTPARQSGEPALAEPGDGVRTLPSIAAPPETVGAALGAEEHAQRVDPKVGEETGAADPPAQAPPQGEYAQAEEVGSPEAPSKKKT